MRGAFRLPTGATMHYKNGREAKNGDKVVFIPAGLDGKLYHGQAPKVGILYDAQAGNDFCNGNIAPLSANDTCPNLKECLHLDDFMASIPTEVPDTSKK